MRMRELGSPLSYFCACVLVLTFAPIFVAAQTTAPNEWTWINGPQNAVNSNPVWGTLGTLAAGNLPARRYRAAHWTDDNGNLWLFGGFGYGSSIGQIWIFRNDLWEFSPSLNEWGWMGGSDDTGVPSEGGMPGIYGTLGASSSTNIPGGREGASSWSDSNGNFWLFGGSGFDSAGTFGRLNDLWIFEPDTSEWTWVSGSNISNNCFEANTYTFCAGQSGIYGTQGTAAPTNTPGAREGSATWGDKAGNLWLFGGVGIDPTAQVNYYFNDLWKFSLSTRQWTWVSGNSTPGPQVACQFDPNGSFPSDCGYPGIYGTLDSPTPANTPGARTGANTWVDRNGNLWLFGGEGFDAVGNINPMNDLWEFTPSNSQWTWKGGASSVALCISDWIDECSGFLLPGTYGTQGVPAVGNLPSYTSEAATWTDTAGNFWLFSGVEASYSNGLWPPGQYWGWNDLWMYSPSANEWTWMTGTEIAKLGPSSSNGSFGTQGVPAASNNPPTLTGAAAWNDLNGNFWLFGGANDDYFNAMWEFQPSAPTPEPSFALIAAASSVNVTGGASSSSTVSLIVGGGFDSLVALTASGQPSGVTVSYSPSSITGTESSQITIAAVSSVTPGTYPITVIGTSGAITETTTINAVVTAPQPSFALSANPGSLTISSSSRGSVTLNVTPQNGFNSAVNFACSGQPGSVMCTFNPTTVTPSGSAITTQLTFTAAAYASAQSSRTPLLPAAMLCLASCALIEKRRRNLRTWFLLAIFAISVGTLGACGAGNSGGGGTNPITSTVTVTATSGSIQETTTITLVLD